MFMGVVALYYLHHTMECHNSHKHSQSCFTKCEGAVHGRKYYNLFLCYEWNGQSHIGWSDVVIMLTHAAFVKILTLAVGLCVL